MRATLRDLRHAVRGVMRKPAYSLPVIATLAIGIGANTAIFSVFNWILFRPVPGVARQSELVTMRFVPANASGGRFFVSYRDIADLRSGMPALAGLAAAAPLSMNVRFGTAEPERVEGEVVTANYLDVLGATPREGRRFHADEEQPGPLTPAAIVSDTLRRRVFGNESPTPVIAIPVRTVDAFDQVALLEGPHTHGADSGSPTDRRQAPGRLSQEPLTDRGG